VSGMMGRGGGGQQQQRRNPNPGAAPPEYAHLTPGQTGDPFAPGADARMLNAVGNPNAESANPMDAGSIMPNGTHTMFGSFENQGGLLKISSNGDVDFTGRLMDHYETMVRVLRAPDGIHYRIGSVNFPNLWLQILPDGSVNGNGTIDSPYGEFELCTPKPFCFTFVGCATQFSLAAQRGNGKVLKCVKGMEPSAVFKFGAPPTAGTKPYPEYVTSNRSMYITMDASAAMNVNIQGPEFTIKGPKVELDEHGRIKSFEGGSVDVKSMGSASASSSTSVAVAAAITSEEIKKRYGVHCAGFMPPAGDGSVPNGSK
jgi:hypothetical protein